MPLGNLIEKERPMAHALEAGQSRAFPGLIVPENKIKAPVAIPTRPASSTDSIPGAVGKIAE